jgi:glycosyltransferase involved in cell wall biosynthesis
VIISAYNSDDVILGCLASLEKQIFMDFETIVVNSSQEERTRNMVSQFFPGTIFLQFSRRLLPHAAQNAGVQNARGKILAFIDPDCRARNDWLGYLVKAQEDGKEIVGGSMEPHEKSWFEIGAHLTKFHWLLSGLPSGDSWILPTSNVCYSRRVLEKIGQFDGSLFCGDAVQSWRVKEKGYRLWFEPKAVVEHIHGGNLISFCRQRFERGREFVLARRDFEEWSQVREFFYLFLLPMLVFIVMMRAGYNSIKGGRACSYFLTIPVQLSGHLSWAMGEGCALWKSKKPRRNKKDIDLWNSA